MEPTAIWDLPVLIFCGEAKVTLAGAKAASLEKNAAPGNKKRLVGICSTVLIPAPGCRIER
jgi:hypothetical protein